MAPGLNQSTASYCYLDFDIDNHRKKLATAAAFVHATDSRYGFSSKDLRLLGGSEIARIRDLIASDHEWSDRAGDVEIRPPEAGNRVVVRLFWDVAPMACENFATLCANGSVLAEGKKVKSVPIGTSGKPLTYRGSNVHRVVPGFIIQGGDFVFGNGSGGESIFNGKKFKDERAGLGLKHDRRGVLSMGNSGKNSNSSQWFITLKSASQCDGKHVVFGEVISGWCVIDAVEALGATDGTPNKTVTITDCGIWVPWKTPGAGYFFDQPDDESYSGSTPVFMTRPRVAVLAASGPMEKFTKALGSNFTVTHVNVDEYDSECAQSKKIEELLRKHEVDVVLVAPAYRNAMNNVSLPESDFPNPALEGIVLVAKPADALKTIRSLSWLSRGSEEVVSSWHMAFLAD